MGILNHNGTKGQTLRVYVCCGGLTLNGGPGSEGPSGYQIPSKPVLAKGTVEQLTPYNYIFPKLSAGTV